MVHGVLRRLAQSADNVGWGGNIGVTDTEANDFLTPGLLFGNLATDFHKEIWW